MEICRGFVSRIRRAGVRTAALFVCLGSFAHGALPNWTLVWTNDTFNVGICSNDQNDIVLNVARNLSDPRPINNNTLVPKGYGVIVGHLTNDNVYGAGIASGGGYLDMRGVITGKDEHGTNAVWQFSFLRNWLFRTNDGHGNATPAWNITGFHSPGTLDADGWNGNVFHCDGAPYATNLKTDIIINEPYFTGNPGNWVLNGTWPTNIVLVCPKATAFDGGPLQSGGSWPKTDLGLWDLRSVTTCGSTWGCLRGKGYGGKLYLPSLQTVVNVGAFADCSRMQEVELGTTGNALSAIGATAFKNCTSLTNVVLGANGTSATTIGTNAFWGCSALKTVFFRGNPPTIERDAKDATAYTFGTADTAEGAITFYAFDTPAWSNLFAVADANGGFVPAETFNTARPQRLQRYALLRVNGVQDPRFSERYRESVTVTGLSDDGVVREGDVVTLSATAEGRVAGDTDPRRSTFLRWTGVPREYERMNPLTVTRDMGLDLSVTAVFAHDWLMTDEEEPGRTMHNGIWKICVFKRDTAARTLGIGKAADKVDKGCMYPDDVDGVNQKEGEGDLNLNGKVWDSEGKAWTIDYAGSLARWQSEEYEQMVERGTIRHIPTRLTYPETLVGGRADVNYDNWCAWPLEELVMICPHWTGPLTQFFINGETMLTYVLLRIPSVTRIQTTFLAGRFVPAPGNATSMTDWDLSGVTNLADLAFRDCAPLPGTLSLPNVQTVGTNAFYQMAAMTAVVLGTNGLSLTSLGDMAFADCKKLTTIHLGTKRLAFTGPLGASSVFAGTTALTDVHFNGPVLDAETVDTVLAAIQTSDGAKQTTLHASPFLGWTDLMTSLTDAERAVAPAGVKGVYRAGSRKAWYVYERSPYEPAGTLLIFR